MMDAYIPYGCYWSTPFARWQSAFSHLHALRFAAFEAQRELKVRGIEPTLFDMGVLGTTVPQQHSFYGLPWVAGLIGATHLPGPTINQACATSVRCLATAAHGIAYGDASSVLVMAADRTSNGPHIYYPAPAASGGTGASEDWVLGNFSHDPFAGCGMIETAENVARKWSVTTEQQHDAVLRRYVQYQDALANGSSFLARFMTLPFEIPNASFEHIKGRINGDQGIQSADANRIGQLSPVLKGGTVTFAGQTHPADGNAAAIVTTRDKARELSRKAVTVRIVAFGEYREDPAMMPAAPVGAARRALAAANLTMGDITAVKSHNPFIVNDIVFAHEMGCDLMSMNNFGCSLVWGHPQGPTGLRGIIELIEELEIRGGGYGLFQGCAAGDSAMAIIIKVE